jgi:hypothetical protein
MTRIITIVKLDEDAVAIAKFRYVMRVRVEDTYQQERSAFTDTILELRDQLYSLQNEVDWNEIEGALALNMAWCKTIESR